ncbi:MAG: L,D-transpeptidase, partial [Deltaproteobacteria bacterium]
MTLAAGDVPNGPVSAPTRSWPAVAEVWPVEGATDQVFSKVRFLWIRPEPTVSAGWIGYLSLGDSVPLRGGSLKSADAGPGSGASCSRWVAIEPRGYVCIGSHGSLDGNHPDVVELRKRRAKHTPLPYHYGESLGTTVYVNVPPRRRQFFREAAFDAHMADVEQARRVTTDQEVAAINPALVGVDLRPTGQPPPPSLLHLGPQSGPQKAAGKNGFPEVVGGSTMAYSYSFDADDRCWVMTWDRGIIPKDRVRVFPQSAFHGVALGDGIGLPIVFFRQAQPQLRRSAEGVAPTGGTWPRHSWAALTGETVELAGERYLVAENGLLCRASEVSAPRLRDEPPVAIQRADGRRTWVDISITEGWLVAYENRRPVYATMVSPGRGGLPQAGKTLLEVAATPVGDFGLTGKFHTATMTSNFSAKVVHSEVPYT